MERGSFGRSYPISPSGDPIPPAPAPLSVIGRERWDSPFGMAGERMSTLLLAGTAVGAVLGIVHAWGVYRGLVRDLSVGSHRHPMRVRARAWYSALWTAALWTAFGSYVLVLWLLSVPIWTVYKLGKGRSFTTVGA